MARIWFLVLIFSLILIKPTNADFVFTKSIKHNQFSATTLDFSQLKTTNESTADILFNIDSILPGGYQVNTLRIKNQGKSNLHYQIFSEKKSGDDNLCRNLDINLSKNNQTIYQGKLVDLSLVDSFNSEQNFIDWLVTLKLNPNYLGTQSVNCQFNLNILGFNQDLNQKSGFEYQRVISNYVSFN